MAVEAHTVQASPACTACTASQSTVRCTAATKAWEGVAAPRLPWLGHRPPRLHAVTATHTPALSALSCQKREITPLGKNYTIRK